MWLQLIKHTQGDIVDAFAVTFYPVVNPPPPPLGTNNRPQCKHTQSTIRALEVDYFI